MANAPICGGQCPVGQEIRPDILSKFLLLPNRDIDYYDDLVINNSINITMIIYIFLCNLIFILHTTENFNSYNCKTIFS